MASSVAAVVVGAKEEILLCSKEKTSPKPLKLRFQTDSYGIIISDSGVCAVAKPNRNGVMPMLFFGFVPRKG